jgi:hypothetical protein
MKNDIEITVLCLPGFTLSFQPDGIAGISARRNSYFYLLGFSTVPLPLDSLQ